MEANHWRRIEALYHSALERPLEQRSEFLQQACGSDSELLRDVESLLAHDEHSNALIDRAAWERAEGSLHVAELKKACEGDAELRGEVESLLAQSGNTEPLTDQTAWADGGSEEPSAVLAPGARMGPYQILGPLGEGGMGKVYRGLDTRLGRAVAIKISAEQFSKRFEHEARAISALNHPNICTLYDVGPNYMVTELVEGETLRDWLKRPSAVERSLEIARQVLEALRAAHNAGIIHRDLKPANIMIRSDGFVKVLDFGLAKRMPATGVLLNEDTVTNLSIPGQILGTPAYMSPEQIQGQEVDPRSDQFALGTVLYEMLTGEHPWRRRSVVDTLHAILHDDAPAMDAASPLLVQLAPIVQKLLSKNPAERYPFAEAVLDALASITTSSSAAAVAKVKPLISIAVLPFVFLNEVEERKALSLGFADALITMLGSLEDFAVLPTSAILNYAAGSEPVQTCRNLGVRHVLQGNIQKLGTHWRVSMQLFDGMKQTVAHSEKHDFVGENVFDIQDEIGRRVAESLQTRFPRQVQKSRDRYSSDPEAFDEFMAGLRESYVDQEETLRSADRHLSRAVERDPEFALAHAWLSQVSMQIHYTFDAQRAWLEKAEHHCHRALALDPGLPEGHWARAAILWSPAKNFQHAEAIAALEQVLAARPNFDRAHNRMATICCHIGRFHEARLAHEQAVRANPRNRSYNLEYIYLSSGDFARAEEAAQTWLREAPGSRAACCFGPLPPLMTGDLNLAEQRLAAGLKLHPDEPWLLSLQGMLHARRNETGAALECVRKALDLPITLGHAHHTYYQVGCVYAVLGETEKAMAWLERSVYTGNPCWPFFKLDPHMDNLRAEPRFQRLVAGLEREYTALQISRP